MKEELLTAFPVLKNANNRIWNEIEEFAIFKKYHAHEIVALEGDTTHYFPLVLSGNIRVYKCGDSGKEITLYKVRRGDCCVLTALSILGQTGFGANAVVDTACTTVAVPAPVFRDWINRHDLWRSFVFQLIFQRITEIISKVEALAFQRVDERVAAFLLQSFHKEHRPVLRVTHSDIARELGTAREVVSRVLKTFEREKLVQLSRGRITIINHRDLQRHSRLYNLTN